MNTAQCLEHLKEAKEILVNEKDEELKEMARGEIAPLEERIEALENDIRFLMVPSDPPEDVRHAIMKIRVGTVEMKQVYLRETFLECTRDIVKDGVGKLKWLILTKEPTGRDTKKLFSTFWLRVPTEY